MSQRVLIISPHFPPTNAADMQRVRLVLPYLSENGWQAEVVAVAADDVASPRDEWLVDGLPAEVPVHRVRALGLGWSCIPGLGTLTFRALRALRRKGDELLQSGRFELVYFSTTQFGVHVLGPRWKKKFGVPFVMDYQDPWVSDYYRTHPQVRPPGGRFKYALADWLNHRQEPRVLRQCSGITSVSADYPKQLQQRYGWLEIQDWERGNRKTSAAKINSGLPNFQFPLLSIVLPFPGDERDLQRVKSDGTIQNIFSPNDGCQHWVYAGVCIPQMFPALRAFFLALSEKLKKQPALKLQLHFIGTSYAPEGTAKKMVLPVAEEFGLAGMVTESPGRIPYSQTLRCLLDADALIVPGSDDPGYTASKIYPYLLAGKPLLAVFHENSSVVSLLQKVRGGVCVPFQTGESPVAIAARISESGWFEPRQKAEKMKSVSDISPLDRAAFEPHTARAQAQVLAEFFSETQKTSLTSGHAQQI